MKVLTKQDSNQEAWKCFQVGYHISDKGRVLGLRGMLAFETDKDGYMRVSAGRRHFLVHRLVAQAFIPNPHNKPQVNHINAIKADNATENLEWSTAKENIAHSIGLGLQQRDPSSYDGRRKLATATVMQVRRLYGDGVRVAEIARTMCINYGTVKDIVARKTWKHLEAAA